MLGKQTGQNKPVPLGKNWHVNFSCLELQVGIFAPSWSMLKQRRNKKITLVSIKKNSMYETMQSVGFLGALWLHRSKFKKSYSALSPFFKAT